MNRLTRKASKKELIESKYMFNYVDNSVKPNPLSNPRKVSDVYDKLGQLEDLEEEIGVNNLIHFLKWCVKYRNNFINRSFDSLIAFYKKAMCETEKDKSE